ncbi:MAG: hypothetical protein WCO77_00110 [bacterium]
MTARFHKFIVGGLICALGTTIALIGTSCDTASANEELTISPSSATLSSGQSQTFTVTGGYHYGWEIFSGSASSTSGTTYATGRLSSNTGSQVLYTAPSSDTGLSGSVTLRCTSTIEGSASSGTSNSPAYTVTSDVIITFK